MKMAEDLQKFEKMSVKMEWEPIRMEQMKPGDIIRFENDEDEAFKVASEPYLVEIKDGLTWGVQVNSYDLVGTL